MRVSSINGLNGNHFKAKPNVGIVGLIELNQKINSYYLISRAFTPQCFDAGWDCLYMPRRKRMVCQIYIPYFGITAKYKKWSKNVFRIQLDSNYKSLILNKYRIGKTTRNEVKNVKIGGISFTFKQHEFDAIHPTDTLIQVDIFNEIDQNLFNTFP